MNKGDHVRAQVQHEAGKNTWISPIVGEFIEHMTGGKILVREFGHRRSVRIATQPRVIYSAS